MNRECGCLHNARNIKINRFTSGVGKDEIKIVPDDMEANVQNALEVLSGFYANKGFDYIEEQINQSRELLNQIQAQKRLVEQISGFIAINPYSTINNDLPLYYKSPFMEEEYGIPDLNGNGEIDAEDYSILYYFKWDVDNNRRAELQEYLNRLGNGYSLQNKDIYNNLSEKWKKIFTENDNFYITDYDLDLITSFIKEVDIGTEYIRKDLTKRRLYNSEDWFFYINYVNPLMKLQCPDFNEDGILDATDASISLQLSAQSGIGQPLIYTNSYGGQSSGEEWKNIVSADLASQILSYAAGSGLGIYSSESIQGWKEFILKKR